MYGIKGLVIHKEFLIANLFLIKTFLIAKFDCNSLIILFGHYELVFVTYSLQSRYLLFVALLYF